MRLPMRQFVAVFVLVAVSASHASAQSPKTAKHALLVGVSNYPNLDKRFHLAGPANDVLLLRDLLEKQFDFPKENIAILAEHQGEKRWPTRANIEAEFQRLAKIAKPGDNIVILMGGHGSQQPEPPMPKDPEPDGLDEIFLPRDVGAWDGAKGTVKNAIIDDELGEWLKAIQDKKAHVFIIFDACHSGTMTRGTGADEKTRELEPMLGLGVPKDAIDKSVAAANERFKGQQVQARGGKPNTDPTRQKMAALGGVVALYACQDTEVTIEQDLPRNSSDAKPYGLLTYTLCQLLTQSAQNTGRPPTYRELVQNIHSHYSGLGRKSPTPQLEAKPEDLDREVLGTTVWTGRSLVLLAREGKQFTINAGSLHGMTEGSVLAVLPPANVKDRDKLQGHVRISQLKTLSAIVEPCEFEEHPIPKKLLDAGRCEVVRMDLGLDRLKLALDPNGFDKKPVPDKEKSLVAKELTDLYKELAAMVEEVKDPAKADWVLRIHKDEVFMVSAAEFSAKTVDRDATALGPFKINKDLGDKLDQSFKAIVRVENLKKIGVSSLDAAQKIKLDVDVLLLKDKADVKGKTLKWDSTGMTLFDKDWFKVRMVNKSSFNVDVTLLFIDSGYGIGTLNPGTRQRMGEPYLTDPENISTEKTKGQEHLLIIAVKATGPKPADFSFLAQDTLPRGTPPTAARAGQTPLEALLRAKALGEGNTRSVPSRAAEEYTVRLIPWITVDGERSKGKK